MNPRNFYVIFYGIPHLTILLLPVVLIPLLIFILGIGWIFSALGVYIRDISQIVGMLTTMLMFLSPIFYPVEALPTKLQSWIFLNPLTFIIEQSRDVIIWGKLPSFKGLAFYYIPSLIVAFTGYAFFNKSKKAFADVL